MSKTNFDDLDLQQRGIEAGEINSETAAAGTVLTADGVGGAMWLAGGAALLRMFHDSEDQFAANTAHDLTNGTVEVNDPGFVYDPTSGEITIGPELDGKRLLIHAQSGVWNASQDGWYRIYLRLKQTGLGYFSTIGENRIAVAQSDDPDVASVDVMWPAQAGDKYAVRVYLSGAAAGTGEWSLDHGITSILAL